MTVAGVPAYVAVGCCVFLVALQVWLCSCETQELLPVSVPTIPLALRHRRLPVSSICLCLHSLCVSAALRGG
ncbi:hypothetical protein PF005_g17560 [Phytophthora fragariae]|uniref:Uncharacterized protein n=1 Tax=Phytophthora fragariae TaxID=53985 RepID=A0A6A3X9C9_9STRA|nr:hypothetical protein PF009_g12696 [Phytophthora fragariae]KAE9010920.1 hypothetical protein PF011_g9596 [Phytophthora fragariae]KAE9101906.1 hypothetical protein PF007_g14948 [Phytophthora fragariae]KAE9105519.1 hypothetical protein PF010_g12984 [Phytophthora fragariae]KAE9112660.1 hypothetical protein PF006_g19925 [Phytophthora fragariae]